MMALLLAGCETARPRTGAPITRSDGSVRDGELTETGVATEAGFEADANAGEDAASDGGYADASTGIDATPGRDAAAPDASSPEEQYCRGVCTTRADCVSSPTPITDSDNYTCTSGRCEYLGCNSTAECELTFQSDYVCVQFPGYAFPSCVKTCAAVADCAAASPLFEAENYRCTQNGCEWRGCLNSQECRDVYQDSSYVCERPAGYLFDTCIKPCNSVNDCVSASSPLYDADNYSCTANRCVYLGCNSTSECTASQAGGTWICE
jgi:hypothetical protein